MRCHLKSPKGPDSFFSFGFQTSTHYRIDDDDEMHKMTQYNFNKLPVLASCGRFHNNTFFRFWLNCQPIRHCIPELTKINWLFIVLHKGFGAKSKFEKQLQNRVADSTKKQDIWISKQITINWNEHTKKNWNFWSCFMLLWCYAWIYIIFETPYIQLILHTTHRRYVDAGRNICEK